MPLVDRDKISVLHPRYAGTLQKNFVPSSAKQQRETTTIVVFS